MKERPEVLCLKLKSEKWKTNGKNKKNKKKNWLEILLEQKHGQTGLFYCENGKKNNKKTANFLKFHVVRRSKTARQGPAEAPRGSVIAGGLPCPPASFLVLFCLVLIVPYRIVSYRIVSSPSSIPRGSRRLYLLVTCLSFRQATLPYVTSEG